MERHMSFTSPPPAYSDQEFDQKIILATELSSEHRFVDDASEWEEWDEVKFEAAARESSQIPACTRKKLPSPKKGFEPAKEQGPSSSSRFAPEHVQPLHIQKKSQRPKPRKDVLDMYSLQLPSSLIEESRRVASPPIYSHTDEYSRHGFSNGHVESMYESQRIPFHRARPQYGANAVDTIQPVYSFKSYRAPIAAVHDQLMGESERQDGPRIKFCPSLAYMNPLEAEDTSAGILPNVKINASSFYNSAISAHLATPTEFASRPAYSISHAPALAREMEYSSSHIGHDRFENSPTPIVYTSNFDRSFASPSEPNEHYSSYPASDYSES
ncbi:hypothetical protein BDQ17DRAFT_1349423 [Cyathus striatus]|nr:hypothetical protein BDQ17DRAFT_1349423 [Cyathus striatus]